MLSMRNEFKQSLSKFELDNRNTIFIEKVVKFNISIPIFGFGYIYNFMKEYIKKHDIRTNINYVISVGGLLSITQPNPRNMKFSPNLKERIQSLSDVKNRHGCIIQSIDDFVKILVKGDISRININNFELHAQPYVARCRIETVFNMKFIEHYGLPLFDNKRQIIISSKTNEELPPNLLIQAVSEPFYSALDKYSNGNADTQLVKVLSDPFLRKALEMKYAPEEHIYKASSAFVESFNEFRFQKMYDLQVTGIHDPVPVRKVTDTELADLFISDYAPNATSIKLANVDFSKYKPELVQVKHLSPAALENISKSTMYIERKSQKYIYETDNLKDLSMLFNLSGFNKEDANNIITSFRDKRPELKDRFKFVLPKEDISMCTINQTRNLIKYITDNF